MEPLNFLRDIAQGASNSAASTVSGPVDLAAWLMRKAGVPVQDPVGGSDWMARVGLTAQPKNALAGMAGETLGNILPIVAAAKAPQIANALLRADEALQPAVANALEQYMVKAGMIQPATVWHGSPHKFDKFDAAHIGKGEGAQAYGHGLYLAEAQKVGKGYADAFRDVPMIDGAPAGRSLSAAEEAIARAGSKQQAIKTQEAWVKKVAEYDAGSVKAAERRLGEIKATADRSYSLGASYLYKVDLPDEAIARMLDWDKPLSQQAPEVQKHFEPMVAPIRAQMAKPADPGWGDLAAPSNYDPTGQELLSLLRKKDAPQTAQQFLSNGLGQDISAMLRQQGIPGIRYLDGGSRGAGQGTSNYVVFPGEEALLTILERNGVPMR